MLPTSVYSSTPLSTEKGLILRESPYKPAKLEKREKSQQQHSDNILKKTCDSPSATRVASAERLKF